MRRLSSSATVPLQLGHLALAICLTVVVLHFVWGWIVALGIGPASTAVIEESIACLVAFAMGLAWVIVWAIRMVTLRQVDAADDKLLIRWLGGSIAVPFETIRLIREARWGIWPASGRTAAWSSI